MKKSLITIVSALCIVASSATMAGAVAAFSRFPTTCPPATVVGKALGLTVSKPTVAVYAKGMALECDYTNGKGSTMKTTVLSYTPETRKAFLAAEKALPKSSVVVVTNLGKGVAAYRMTAFGLYFQYGTLQCVISTMASPAHQVTLAKVLLKSYW
jgi:hypothetical protein